MLFLVRKIFHDYELNSSSSSAAYMRPWTGSALVQVMAWRRCWLIVNLPLRTKLQWNSNRNSIVFSQQNVFENVVCETTAISPRGEMSYRHIDIKLYPILFFVRLPVDSPHQTPVLWIFDFFVAGLHDDVIKWKPFPRYWPFVRGIHRSPVNSPHKDQWRGALMFSRICAWINGRANTREAGDLRRHHAHYDVIVMEQL